MFSLDDYDYHLPPHLIAQTPAARRDMSRLLVLDRRDGRLAHQRFHDVHRFLGSGDVLVVNDTRVVSGRLIGRKATGGRVELLILDYARYRQRFQAGEAPICKCLIKSSKPAKPGSVLYFDPGARAEVTGLEDGIFAVRWEFEGDFDALIDRIGRVPLPPYIHRPMEANDEGGDREAYQTVYAANRGAVAAPTAGLHFTEALLDVLRRNGVQIVNLTLHVGYGTFLPVRSQDIRDHRMHAEWFHLSEAAADAIRAAKAAGRRVVAVGTTCVRTLEFAARQGKLAAGSGDCDLFIYPGFEFKVVDAMITNFHLPKSSLIMLVSAFAGREKIRTAYQAAIAHAYRFYSYGDAMMII